MRNLLKKSSTGLLCAILTASVFAAKQSKELLTPENMKKWESGIESRYRGAIKFDSNKRQVSISTYESNGQAEFYDLKNQYDDFRIDCVVSFSKLRNKWSGFNIYLRAGDGKHYWVFWRPKNRNLDVVKIHSKHKVINEYYKGRKMSRLPPKIKMNKDYTFSVEMRGRLLRVFLDGKKNREFIDPLPELYTSGKIAFTGGSSDLIIKSIKITDLRESEKLAIKNYKYINPPEKGDRSGNILADGKINGKDKQALWWLATKGDPVIVFDLGKQYFINGIELKALAVPSSNISAYRVFGSDDGKKWKLMAGEVNNSTDSREQEQTLHSKFSALARYLKVMLFRQAGDATIKLDEVEIMGREVRPEDKAATQVSKEYYKGPKIPAVTINGKKDKNWHYLEGGGLRVAINQRTGNIGPIYNISKRKRCTMFTYDKYYVETKKSAQEFSEKNNTVIKSSNKNGVLIFTCRNKNIKDIDIVQTYKSTADGFSKTTELINRGGREDLFVTLKTGTVLDQKFRKNGWYLGADRGLGSRLKASQVTMPMTATCHSPQNTKVVLFMNYDKNFGIGQYRYAINGKYCSPVAGSFTEKSNHASLYTANGWKVGLTTLHLKPGRQQSIETRWNLFPDDEFFFLKQYTADTEVNKLFNIKRADWLYRIKTCNAAMSTPVCRSNKEFTMRWIKRSADLYDDGFIYSFFCADDVWGDWYDGKRYGLGWRGEKVDNNFYRELLDDLRKQSANIKVGVYTWAWTGWPYSKSYLKHPDWFIAKNKNGYLSKAYQNGPMNFLRRISASGCMENLLTCARKIIKQYDSDAFYIDGGGGGINRIDWQRLKLDLDSDWYKFHWELNKLCRKIGGRERVFFTNSRSQAYVDIGYYEGANNVLGATSWRSSGDALLALKMRNSLFPKMTFPLLYWRSNTLPFYSNYCVGLGLVPYNIYSSHELRNVAYVTAAYESRMFKFTPSGLIPDWRKNLESQLEAYTMTHAPAGFISIINHSKLPIPETISADAKKLGLDTRKPIFCWLTRMHDIRNRKRTTGMSERTAKKVYSNSNWGVDLVAAPTFKGIVKTSNGRVSLTEKFDHNILNMAMFSNCPAVVFAVNGRRKQIWQPNTRGITLHGNIDLKRRSIALIAKPNVTADAKNAEILVYVPNDWYDINISGASLKQQVFLKKQRFLLLKLDKFEKITLKASKVRSFKLKGGEKAVTVYDRGVPVFFGNSENLKIPQELASGKYQIDILSGKTLSTKEITVKNTWEYDYVSDRQPRTAPQLLINKVNRVVKGIKILSTGVNSSNGYNLPQFTRVDPDTLTFAAGNTDSPTSRYGFAVAGMEFEQLRIVQLQVRNTFFRHWSNHELVTWRSGDPNDMVGLIVDYHTPKGYSKRVALSLGLLHAQMRMSIPSYGKKTKPDAFVRLGDYIHQSKEAKFVLDLSQWAPSDWDGRVWMSAATNGVVGGRKIFVKIISNSDSIGKLSTNKGELISSGKLMQPKLKIPAISTPIKIDGNLNDKAWGKAAKSSNFKQTISMRKPDQKTVMFMCRDNKNLYIAVKCSELERKHLISDSAKIWGHDAVDISFAPLPRSSNKFHKFVINYKNEVYQASFPHNRKQSKWLIATATSRTKNEWIIEMEIPLKYLKLKGGEMAFNLLRYRPDASGTPAFSWSLIPIYSYCDPKWFGSIIL